MEDSEKHNQDKNEERCPPGYKIVGRSDNGAPIYGEIEPKLYTVDKERIMVNRITAIDMLQFNMIPYDLNSPIIKFTKEGTHPFAYMDLNEFNQNVAKQELERIGKYISDARGYIPSLSEDFMMDISKIEFKEYDPGYGYTKIICTPYTFSGKVSKNPLTLSFMSRVDSQQYEEIGSLYYSVDGSVQKAEVHIWRRESPPKPASGWSFYFETIDDVFLLYKALSTFNPDEYGRPGIVYRCRHLVEEEAAKEQDKFFFEWVKDNLPNDCPKSFSGFRRMKASNSKNYQALVAKAEAAGFVFPETLEDAAALEDED